jgi:hypothetical protein
VSSKYALIHKSKEFTLIMVKFELERFRGKFPSETVGSQGINWGWNAKRVRVWGFCENRKT